MSIDKQQDYFLNDDVIYHYTNLYTALEYILDNRIDNRTLRLSPRGNSIDPVENWDDYLPMGVDFANSKKSYDDKEIKDIYNYLKNRLLKAKQVCFCMNNSSESKLEHTREETMNRYGFLKPRMWSQYADSFRGVCLAFSKNKLKENNPKLVPKTIIYAQLHKLPKKKIDFYAKDLDDLGIEKCKKKYQDKLDEFIFSKHQDYFGENEFRFCSFSEYEYDYLDISHSLKGIFFIENKISEFAKKSLLSYGREYKVNPLGIKWGGFGIGFNIYTNSGNKSSLE